MIGLDTNIIIRYLVQDDPIQSQKANHLIATATKSGKKLLISQITLCEVAWLLERTYKVPKIEFVQIIKSLLQTEQLVIESDDVVWQALQDYEKASQIDFPDCLIGRQNLNLKCDYTYTFDVQAAKRVKTFKLLL